MTTRERRCCVCDDTLEPQEVCRLGNRDFCRRHYDEALEATRRPWWQSALYEIGAVALFVAAAAWLGGDEPVEATVPVVLALCAVPALLLMVWVYRQDRVEREPFGLVLSLFVLGALFGEAVAVPVLRDVFRVQQWEHLSLTATWVSALLVRAVVVQTCVYVAVRYSVYLTDELDEPADGVVYAGAAGLGLVTVRNLHVVAQSETVLLLETATWVASTCLVALAASAALGYGLARRRLRAHPKEVWIAAAFVVSVGIHGGLGQLVTLAGIDGGSFRPWISLSVAAGVVAVVLIALDWLMERLSRESFEPEGARGPS